MQIHRWRNLLSMNNYMIPSATNFSAFHSTPCLCQKWNSKGNNSDERRGQHSQQQPSKNQIRIITRQRRADTKKALNDLLYRSGASKFSLEDKETKWKIEGNPNDRLNSYSNKDKPKHRQRNGGKPQKKTKQKMRRQSFAEDVDGHPEQVFEAKFGNKWYTWTTNLRGSASEFGFEWRQHSSRTHKWKSASDAECDDDSSCVGSSSDRTVLGLPPRGPLKIEDVKNAFRLSALKWHPDKHQGPSQAIAEEKFKLCVNAYKTLCNALSPS